MRYTDKEIIDGLRKKDDRINSWVYKRYFPMCNSIVNNRGGSIVDVEDTFQDAMQAITLKVTKHDFEIKSSFTAYLFAILFNLWKLQLERKRRDTKFKLVENPELTVEQVIDECDRLLCTSVLWNCYQELHEKCRLILKLVWQDYPLREIAEILSIEYGYLRKQKSNCFQSLSDIIKNSDYARELLRKEFPDLYAVLK